MPSFCCVLRCSNRSDRDEKSFFKLPAILSKGEDLKKRLSGERRKKWIAALRRSNLDNAQLNLLKVCEDHFVTGKPADLFDLEHPDWVPSLNMGFHKNASYDLRRKRIISKLNCESGTSDDSETSLLEQTEFCNKESVECQTEFTLEDLRNMEQAYSDIIVELTEVRDKVSKLTVSEEMFKDDDGKTMYYTGMPNYDMLMKVFRMIENNLPHAAPTCLTKFQRYILTLMRLKMNLDLGDLSNRFCTSKSTVLKTFANTIHIMYRRFQNVILWPSRDDLIVREPQSFVDTYGQRVAVIINCFEIMTNKPQNSSQRTVNTIKFLVGICPQGGISFVSSAWEGDTDDEDVVKNCGILERLFAGDIVICDQGVSIHNEDRDVNNAEEDVDGDVEGTEQNQSRFRKYAGKVMNKLKEYKFLKRSMPASVICSNKPEVPALIDQVVRVCCCLINITSLDFDEITKRIS